MPELPEVTVIAGDIAALVRGRRVLRAAVFAPRATNVSCEEFSRQLEAQTLKGVYRRGKLMLLDFGSVVGVVHLFISGRVQKLEEWRAPDYMYSVLLEFEGGVILAFMRLWLGYFELYKPEEAGRQRLISRLGPDPFSKEFSPQYLADVFAGRRARVKSLLLDQSVVAGLGNIYVDEVLFAAKVHPARKANTLSHEEIENLFGATRRILARALELRGTTFDSYHDAFGEQGGFQSELQVFDRVGEPCPECGVEIIKLRVSGRGTHVCPGCQTEH